jgi:hypothetical protein
MAAAGGTTGRRGALVWEGSEKIDEMAAIEGRREEGEMWLRRGLRSGRYRWTMDGIGEGWEYRMGFYGIWI